MEKDISDLTEKYGKALNENDRKVLQDLELIPTEKPPKNVEKILNPNPKFPSFSESVKVEETKLQGRYTVAARDIKPGFIYFPTYVKLKLYMRNTFVEILKRIKVTTNYYNFNKLTFHYRLLGNTITTELAFH